MLTLVEPWLSHEAKSLLGTSSPVCAARPPFPAHDLDGRVLQVAPPREHSVAV